MYYWQNSFPNDPSLSDLFLIRKLVTPSYPCISNYYIILKLSVPRSKYSNGDSARSVEQRSLTLQSNNDRLEKEFERLGEKLDYLENRKTELMQEVKQIVLSFSRAQHQLRLCHTIAKHLNKDRQISTLLDRVKNKFRVWVSVRKLWPTFLIKYLENAINAKLKSNHGLNTLHNTGSKSARPIIKQKLYA